MEQAILESQNFNSRWRLKQNYLLIAGILILLAKSYAWPADRYSPDVPEPGSVEAIRQDTTDAKYLSSWVDYVPESQTVPSPKDFLGHIAGAHSELVRSQKSYAYMRELERMSPRVKVQTIGETEEGREILLVMISDEQNLSRLEELKEASCISRRSPEDSRRSDGSRSSKNPFPSTILIARSMPMNP